MYTGSTIQGRGLGCHKQTGTWQRREEEKRVCRGVQMDDVKLIFDFEKYMEFFFAWE